MIVYQSISEASKTTGLSTYFIRKGLEAGWIPFIKSGVKQLINVPRLLDILAQREEVQANET